MHIVQICFTLKNNVKMEELKEKMERLKQRLNTSGLDYECRSCHLNREICLEKGFTTDVPDMFESVFGKRYVCEVTEHTFDEAMSAMEKHRKDLSKKANQLVILSDETISGVSLELTLFTENRVIVL